MTEVTLHSTEHPVPLVCPKCGVEMDVTAGLSTEGKVSPKPGDATLCVYCATYLCFMPGMVLRYLTDQEFERLPATQRALMKGMKETFSRPSVRARLSGNRRAHPAPPRKG